MAEPSSPIRVARQGSSRQLSPSGAVEHMPFDNTENNKETFMTATRGKRGLAADMPDPPSMNRVKALHSQLAAVVGTLNEKVSGVLQSQESQFLRAYRTSMFAVQKELATLRQKSDDAALQLQKNERIKQLEGGQTAQYMRSRRLVFVCA